MRVSYVLAALVLLLVGGLRARSITDDRTWVDEDAHLLAGFAVPWLVAGPTVFRHADLGSEPTLTSVTTNARENDGYPPVVSWTIFAMRAWPNPVLAMRSVFFVLGLALLVLVFSLVRKLLGPPAAVVALAYVGFSPELMEASQLIKWTALVPVLATAATALLLSLRQEQTTRRWAAYALTMLLLIHTHYFFVWIVPAHLAFAWWAPKPFWQAFRPRLAAIVALSVPWYLWALPSQQQWMEAYYRTHIPTWSFSSYYRLLTFKTLMAQYAYTLAAAGGFQPSPLRTRLLIPLLPLVPLGVFWAARSANASVRRWTFLAIAPYVLGLLGQTAYAWRYGNTIRLSSIYLIAWSPAVLVTLVLGIFELRRVAVRNALIAGVLGIVAINGVLVIPPQYLPQKSSRYAIGSLSDYRSIVGYIGTLREDETAIVHRSDLRAKMFNLFYAGNMLQLVMPIDKLPAGVSQLVLLSNSEDPSVHVVEGWNPFAAKYRAGHAVILVARRGKGPAE